MFLENFRAISRYGFFIKLCLKTFYALRHILGQILGHDKRRWCRTQCGIGMYVMMNLLTWWVRWWISTDGWSRFRLRFWLSVRLSLGLSAFSSLWSLSSMLSSLVSSLVSSYNGTITRLLMVIGSLQYGQILCLKAKAEIIKH